MNSELEDILQDMKNIMEEHYNMIWALNGEIIGIMSVLSPDQQNRQHEIVKQRAEKEGRNPVTGEMLKVKTNVSED